MVPLVLRAGLRWMASDEEILGKTRGAAFTRDAAGHVSEPEALYRPYRVGGEGQAVACGFRDHRLSDLIGFSYGSWSAEHAADDFVDQVVEAGRRYAARTGGDEATIFVILDGENAWESFEGQGRPFLHALYSRLGSHSEIRTVTMTEACAAPTVSLPSIFPGSWINGDFYIWMGHSDDHRAWSQLVDARRALDGVPAAATPAEALTRAREEVLIAEGSDWFWWYGDDHSSEHDRQFDDLFRRHVRNVYEALGRPIPAELFRSNITTEPTTAPDNSVEELIQPTVDGEVTSYFEWLGAGSVDLMAPAGAMHESVGAKTLRSVAFGYDLERLFVRIDATSAVIHLLESGLEIHVNFIAPAGVRARARVYQAQFLVSLERQGKSSAQWEPCQCVGLSGAAVSILELAIPFVCLGVASRETVAFVVGSSLGGVTPRQLPTYEPPTIRVPASATN